MTGHFSGAAVTGLEWVKSERQGTANISQGIKAGPELREYWSAPGLVFVVESWCFQENALEDDANGCANKARPNATINHSRQWYQLKTENQVIYSF